MSTGKTNHHVVFLGVGWGIYGLALLLSCARVYGRFVTTRHPAAGDYLILLTMFTSTAMMVAATFVALFLSGRDSTSMTEDSRLKAAYDSGVLFFILTVALTKAAILLQLAKVFQPFTKRPLYWVCLSLVAFVVLWTIATIPSNIFICGTLGLRSMGSRALGSQCLITTWTIQGVISIVIDCVAMILPIPLVWQLHIPIQQKSMAFAMLAIGNIGCIFTIIRTISLYTPKTSADPISTLFRILLWFTLEALITVCCGALMGSKQLIFHWFPSLNPNPEDILPPMQLDTTLLDPENNQSFIRLDNEDMNKLHLESIMYRLAVIGSPWAQVPKPATDVAEVAKPTVTTKATPGRQQRPRPPSLAPSRPRPARRSEGRRKHDSLITQWTD